MSILRCRDEMGAWVKSCLAVCTASTGRFFRRKIAALRILRPESVDSSKSGGGGSGGVDLLPLHIFAKK